MTFWLITIIIDVFNLYTFYNSALTGSFFFPSAVIPFLGPIFVILTFLIFYLSFLALFLQPNISPFQKLLSHWWNRWLLIIACLGLTFFNFIYTLIFLGLGQESAKAPAWGEIIFLIAILASVFSMLGLWFFLITPGNEHKTTIPQEDKNNLKKHRQKYLNLIWHHPFLASLFFGLSAIIFPVITITYYLYFFTEQPTIKININRKNLIKPITNTAHLLFGGFVLILFYLELGIATGADQAFSHGGMLIYTVVMTLVCFYLPTQGFLSLTDKTLSSRSRWLLLFEAVILFSIQLTILYALS